jgi:hypothetical protein
MIGAGSGTRLSGFWRSILRRWPKAARVTASSARHSAGSGAARGVKWTTLDVTFGWRHEG